MMHQVMPYGGRLATHDALLDGCVNRCDEARRAGPALQREIDATTISTESQAV